MRFAANYGTWQLDDLPGCSQVCVSHSAFVLFGQREKGYGDLYHKRRLQQMKEHHYDYAIATTNSGNEHQKRIMANNGWKELDYFDSSKTGHAVIIWGRDI